MRSNYFAKLMKYLKNVYHIERSIQQLSDGRKYQKYNTAQTIIPLSFGFMLRIKSMNELKYMLEKDEFKNTISRNMELLQIDTIRDTLKVIGADGFKNILVHTVKKAIEKTDTCG